MNLSYRLGIFSAAMLCVTTIVLAAGSTDPKPLQGPMNNAIDVVRSATQTAQQNIPMKDMKSGEDKLDEMARKNDDTPAGSKDKAATQRAEKSARDSADQANIANGTPANVVAYRDALKKRRDARVKLKNICAELAAMLQTRRQSLSNDNKDIENMLEKCCSAVNGAQVTMTASVKFAPGTCSDTKNSAELKAMGCTTDLNAAALPTTPRPPVATHNAAPYGPNCNNNPLCEDEVRKRAADGGAPVGAPSGGGYP